MLRTETDPAPSPTSRWLVATDWLAERLRNPNLIAVDGSYFLPTQKRDAHAEYRNVHIPGAVFFDIEGISDHSTELPHMLPGPTQFGESVGALGIGDGDTVVVYDSVGLFSAARVWWTFRIFGAKSVYILDGGLPKWKAEGRPTAGGDVKRSPRKFTAVMNVGAVALLADVRMALTDDSAQVVDARSAERFSGKAPEPRPGLRSGHMPGAFNVPFDRVLENGRLASRERVAAAFKAAGVDLDKPIITSCGSGVTAAILTLALESLGKVPKGLYDGSWAEWASRPDVPVTHG
ncbi:MAG TPA: 3-mercaptopyruvate sulfurtransferase [Xanthobacteraceae bacterium]|jgi:thiosulfate/3-mercaptopyruvate sulfurtransferase